MGENSRHHSLLYLISAALLAPKAFMISTVGPCIGFTLVGAIWRDSEERQNGSTKGEEEERERQTK